MTLQIQKIDFAKLKEYLASRGYVFEERPHQEFLARRNGTVINLYENGKIVMGGASVNEQNEVLKFAETLKSLATTVESTSMYQDLNIHGTRIGSDEAGKGDYFGPLVACAVMATEEQAEKLKEIGVRDSKRLSADSVREKATYIRKNILSSGQWKVVLIPPSRYNILIVRMGNLNRLLAWAHARAIEDVLRFDLDCSLAISDQFGDKKYIEEALMAKGKTIRLIQTPGGERDVVVAAASIIARQEFVNYVEQMREKYKEEFPLGATHVEKFGKELVKRHGELILLDTAKVHFATTGRLVETKDSIEKLLSDRVKNER